MNENHRKGPLVVVIEDEPALAESVAYALETEGFTVMTTDDGLAGRALVQRHRPALVLLDLMLPGLSGLDVFRQIRRDSNVPIIMLTARDTEADKVAGLELGADDYVTKPFSMRELVARVRSQVRRSSRSVVDTNEVLRGGNITLDLDAHEVTVDGEVVDFRPKEFELLEALMRRSNRLSTRESLIDDVWGSSYFGDTKTLDVHIKRLRHKVEADPSNPTQIVTIRGLGYKFVDET